MKIVVIALGGAAGAVLRFLVSGFVHRFVDATFPWGTLTVNMLGCLAIGLLFGLFENTIVNPNMKSFLILGLLGAFTTYSTFATETCNLLRDGETGFAVFNIAVSNILGIALVFAGLRLAKLLIGSHA